MKTLGFLHRAIEYQSKVIIMQMKERNRCLSDYRPERYYDRKMFNTKSSSVAHFKTA